uniref:Uncharacterized protein n=1 Tax=Anguilla anguilla TaxID=7936 RepID=A0A0E9QHJ6_ANGAN
MWDPFAETSGTPEAHFNGS